MDKSLQKADVDFRFKVFSPNFAERFLSIVNSDGVADELAEAIKWVMANVKKESVATECAHRDSTDM